MKLIHFIKRLSLQIVKGFSEDRLFENASALSFYTLLSIVPIMAVLLGVLQGFGLDVLLEREIYYALPNQKEIAEKLVEFSRSLLLQSKGGLFAGLGILTLLWTFVGMINNFERALNDIWHVTENRSFLRRISDFLSIVLLCPIFFIFTSSLTFFITTEFVHYSQYNPWLDNIGPFLKFALHLSPVALTFVVFSFLYYFIPNTKVPLNAAIKAGLLASIVFCIVQWIYIKFQVGIANYSAIYGSFAAFPLFLIWLQISWLILLLGAAFSYWISFYPYYTDNSSTDISPISTREIALLMMKYAYGKFEKGEPPLTLDEVSMKLHLSHPLLRRIWDILLDHQLLFQVKNNGAVLSRDPSLITVKSVLDVINPSRKFDLSIKENADLKDIKKVLSLYDNQANKVDENLSISKI